MLVSYPLYCPTIHQATKEGDSNVPFKTPHPRQNMLWRGCVLSKYCFWINLFNFIQFLSPCFPLLEVVQYVYAHGQNLFPVFLLFLFPSLEHRCCFSALVPR